MGREREKLNTMKVDCCKFSVICVAVCAYTLCIPGLIDLYVNYTLRKPSFTLADGDRVTCTSFGKLYPSIAWQTRPPTVNSLPMYPSSATQSTKEARQLLQAEKRTCRSGEVPIRRESTKSPFPKIGGRKFYFRSKNRLESTSSRLNLLSVGKTRHMYAIAFVKGAYKGTQGYLNVWQPYVEREEFSLAQVWISSTDSQGNRNVLEAGWQIYEGLYNDRKPRLFIYWTADDYSTTGCYNLDCTGFVQVSNKVLVGGSFVAVSAMNSTQYEIKIDISQDSVTGSWWLQLNDETVGYWPKFLFSYGAFDNTFASPTSVDWGGEVLHVEPSDSTGTITQMGSGQYPSSPGYGRAAYARNLRVVNLNNRLNDLTDPCTWSSFPHCCHVVVNSQGNNDNRGWGTHIFFGGPGFNRYCTHLRTTNSEMMSPEIIMD